MTRAAATLVAFFLAAATPVFAQPYSSIRNGDVVQLRDASAQTIVSILPSEGVAEHCARRHMARALLDQSERLLEAFQSAALQ